MRVYLDSVLIIYLVDQHPTFKPAVEAWLTANPCDLISSELGRLEALVLPTRLGDVARIAAFETFFASAVTELVLLTRPAYDRAIQIRATTSFKTPDALHLAASVEGKCDVFLTNDHKLQRYTGITVEVI